MLLYLVRHGEAEERGAGGDDANRALSAAGRKEMRRVVRRLADLGVSFDVALSSPLRRARETAEVLTAEGVAAAVEEADFLAPGGSFDELRSWLAERRKRHDGAVALVGHQPDLGLWAELLVAGQAHGRMPLKKAGIVGVELPAAGGIAGRCTLFWMTSPKLLL